MRLSYFAVAAALVVPLPLGLSGTPASAALPSWGPPITLSPAGESVGEPRLAMSASGSQQLAVWSAGFMGTQRLQYSVSTDAGQTWSSDTDLTTAGTAVGQPEIAMSSDGSRASVVWWRSNGTNQIVQVRTSTDGGATWGGAIDLSATGGDAEVPQIAMSSDGMRQTVTWQRHNGAYKVVQVSTSIDGGVTWSSPTDLSGASNSLDSAVAVSADGSRQSVTWRRTNGTHYIVQVRTSADGGSSWAAAADLSAPSADAFGPALAMSDDGLQETISWKRGNVIQVTASSDGGANWGAVADVSTASGYKHLPRIAMASSGAVQSVTWFVDDGSSTIYAQVATSSDFGATWSAVTNLSALGATTSTSTVQIVMSDDGQTQTAAWSMEDRLSGYEVIQSASSADGGVTWDSAVDMAAVTSYSYEPRAAMSADGFIQSIDWYSTDGSNDALQVSTADSTPPTPPIPPAPVPASAPLNVAGVAGDRSVTVSWSAPASSGSFPVSSYQVTSTPADGSCLTSSLSCPVSGLSNGVGYSFKVRALTGAGWGPWSDASAAVTPGPPPPPPVVPSITITGTRGEVRGKPGIVVSGSSSGIDSGAVLRPWLRFPGQTSFGEGADSILVNAGGGFTWSRRTGKRVTVYVTTADGSVASNRVTIKKN